MLMARTSLRRTPLIPLTGRRAGLKVLACSLLTLVNCVGCGRHSAVAGNQAYPVVYVAIGDSTGIGLGARDGGGYVDRLFARIDQKRSGSQLINLCSPGATTADVVSKQVSRLADTRATLVTVCVGANDLLRGVGETQFVENYEALVASLKRSARLVTVANLPDIASAPAMRGAAGEAIRPRLERFNKAIEDVARLHGVAVIDLYELSRGAVSSRPDFFSSDGLHPSDSGYAHWAEAMWAVIERALDE